MPSEINYTLNSQGYVVGLPEKPSFLMNPIITNAAQPVCLIFLCTLCPYSADRLQSLLAYVK